MKLKKLLSLSFLTAAFAASCSVAGIKAKTAEEVASPSVSLKANNLAMAVKNNVSGGSAAQESLFPSILEGIVSGSTQLLTKGIAEGATYLVTDILKDYGIDMRDSSVLYLEKIDGEIREIKAKIDALAANSDKYNAERSLDNLYSYVNIASTDVMSQVKGGLWSLSKLENDKTKDAKYVEAQRKEFYETSLKNFTAKGSNIADFVTHFADTILCPVDSAPTNDVFHYYQLTNGQFDKWSTQSYRNRRSFIAYLDSLLLTSANLAVFDNHYRSLGASDAVKATNDTRFGNMVAAVNKANDVFKAELKRLDEYEALRAKGEIIYLPTGQHYSAKMATYTFNHEDKENAKLLEGVEKVSTDAFHKGNKNLQSYLMTYQANHDMVNSVVKDYANYVEAFGLKDYTINQYLKDVGFSAENKDLFDKANGLYFGELNLPHSGYLSDDVSVKAHYFDRFGKYQNKTQFFVEAHHRFLRGPSYNVSFFDQDYYLCFVKADKTLDGTYWGNSFGGDNSNLVDAFGQFLQNRLDSNDPIVKGAKFQ